MCQRSSAPSYPQHYGPSPAPPPSSGPVEPGQMAVALVATVVVIQFRVVLKEWMVKLAMALARHLFGAWLNSRRREAGDQQRAQRVGRSSADGIRELTSGQFVDKKVGSDLDAAVEEENDSFIHTQSAEMLYHPSSFGEEEMLRRSQLFYELMKTRRSVRCFSSKDIPLKIVQNIIKAAGTSPSGANLQPWTFCLIKSDRIKRAIREVVEEQEQINYSRRMGAQWVLDVKPLNVNWNKPYLTEAPFLLVVMKHAYQLNDTGDRKPTYYSEQSTAIAIGILLAAIQNAGLVTVVTTPLNAGAAIREILQRPINEKVSLLLPLGYPTDECYVPDIQRKQIEDIMRIY
uniref:Nitroreductase domain-containing protein n=1 Tax=Globodera rostochiensis TaxID=31243 RepID=A0A914I7H1_GLORO